VAGGNRDYLTTGLGQKIQETKDPGQRESWLLNAIEKADTIRKFRKQILDIEKGTLDMPGFLQSLSRQAIMEIAFAMVGSEDEKMRFQAAKDILDRAGYGKMQKIAVAHAHVDPATTRQELVNMIMTSAKRAGIRTKDIDYIQGDIRDGEIIDSTECAGDSRMPSAETKGASGDSVSGEIKIPTPDHND